MIKSLYHTTAGKALAAVTTGLLHIMTRLIVRQFTLHRKHIGRTILTAWLI